MDAINIASSRYQREVEADDYRLLLRLIRTT